MTALYIIFFSFLLCMNCEVDINEDQFQISRDYGNQEQNVPSRFVSVGAPRPPSFDWIKYENNTSPPKDSIGDEHATTIIIIVSVVGGVFLLAFVGYFIWQKRQIDRD